MNDTAFGSLLIILALIIGTGMVTLLILFGVFFIFSEKNCDSTPSNGKPTEAQSKSFDYMREFELQQKKYREEMEKRRQEKHQQMEEERMIRELVENDVKTSLLNSLEVRARSGDVQAFKEWTALRNSK